MAVTGIVRGIDVEDEAVDRAPAVDLDELLGEEAVQLGHLPGRDGVLQTAEGRLAGQRLLERLAGGHLQDRVVTQTRVVVAVLVAGHEAEETLAHELREVVLGLAGLSVESGASRRSEPSTSGGGPGRSPAAARRRC